MPYHRTPKKVTIDFPDGTSEVYSDVEPPAYPQVQYVVELYTYPKDVEVTDSGDNRFTSVLWRQPPTT